MPTQQGSLSLLNDPVAQQLLQSPLPAHLSYIWLDGTPRVVPIWFHWNGSEIVLGTWPDSPKMSVLRDGAQVALAIDSSIPDTALLIRGTIRIDTVEGVAPEYAAAARRTQGEQEGEAWVAQVAAILPRMSRIVITPEWVGVLDFETRFPSALERSMENATAHSQADGTPTT